MSRYLRVRIVVDRVIAALLLAACAPVIAALGWLVRRHDGGPALIAVDRVGRGGTTFRMWKLRSMRAETATGRATGVSLTAANDDRITPIGHKMRGAHLDELPQLLNVVRGEMALLGPRPEAPEYVDEDDPGWRTVLAAPPAIAGPTQLAVGDWERDVITAAPDGSAYESEVLPVKVAIDRWYVEQATPAIDVRVVLGLVQRLVGRTAYAVVDPVRAHVPEAARALPTTGAEPATQPRSASHPRSVTDARSTASPTTILRGS